MTIQQILQEIIQQLQFSEQEARKHQARAIECRTILGFVQNLQVDFDIVQKRASEEELGKLASEIRAEYEVDVPKEQTPDANG